jgi:hypothetical protein
MPTKRARFFRWLNVMATEDTFELFFVLLCVVSGIPLMLGVVSSPQSLEAALPELLIRIWGATLLLGGLVALCGIGLRHEDNFKIKRRPRFIEGFILEGAGLVALASAAAVIALALIVLTGTKALFGVSTYFMFVLACLFRYRHIRKVVRKMREAIELETRLRRGDW